MLDEQSLIRGITELKLIEFLGNKGKDENHGLQQVIMNSLSYEHTNERKGRWWYADSIDSDLQYYMELLNVGRLIESIFELEKRELILEDIYNLRNTLFKNVLGKYSHSGWRRYLNTRGRDITVHSKDIVPELSALIDLFNKAPFGKEEVLLNSTKLLFELVRIHPFEEGVSRISRLITNVYLHRNGLSSIRMKDDRELLYKFALIYGLSKEIGGLIGLLASFSMSEEKANEFYETINGKRLNEPYAVVIRDTIFRFFGYENTEISSDIKRLYREGKMLQDEGLIKSSLWLSWYNKILDDKLLKTEFFSEKTTVRAMATIVAGDLNLEGYKKLIEKRMIEENGDSKFAAIITLNANGLLNKNLVEKVLMNEKDERTLTILSMQLKYVADIKQFADVFELVSRSPYPGVKVGAYYTLIKELPGYEIIKMINSANMAPEVKKVIIEEICVADRLNEVPICNILSETMLKDSLVRNIILGELTKKESVSDKYLNSLEILIRGGGYSVVERAYALYLIGKTRGTEYLSETFGVEINRDREFLENFAMSLVQVKDRDSKQVFKSQLRVVQNYENNFNFAVEIGKRNLNNLKLDSLEQYKNLDFYKAIRLVSEITRRKVK